MNLAQKKCTPCEVKIPPLAEPALGEHLKMLKTAWDVIEGKKLQKKFAFKNFKEAMTFVNRVAEIAEAEGHHPDIHIKYNTVMLELWTHAIGGLSENDFILAAKIEDIVHSQ